MAYVFNPQLTDEENKKIAEEQALRGTSGIIGGESAGTPPPAGGQPGDKGTASGSFTNLQRYLDENKAGAASLGQKVAGTVTSAGEEAKLASQDVANRAKQAIEAARVRQTGVVDEAVSNPMQVASDAAKKAEFIRQRDAAYGGPAGLEDVEGFDTTQSKIKAAQDKIALTGSEAGRMELLKSLSPNSPGRGKTQLNQLLLSGNEDAGQLIGQSGEPYKNLQDYLSAQSDEARQKATEAATEAASTKKTIQDRFMGEGGALPIIAGDIEARTKWTREEAAKKLERQRKGLEIGSMLPDDMVGLGNGTAQDVRDASTYMKFLNNNYNAGIDPLTYFTQTGSPEADILPENVATPEEYARYAALSELMGQSPSILNPENAAKAGTAGTDFADFDFTGLKGIKDILRERDQEYLNRYGNPSPAYDYLPNGEMDTSKLKGFSAVDLNADPNTTPEEARDRIFQILSRGVGKLPADYEGQLDMTDMSLANLQRILEGKRAQPTPAPGPEQENGGAPPDSLIPVPKPPEPEPSPEPTKPTPESPNTKGDAFYGYAVGGTKIYQKADGTYTNGDGQVQDFTGTAITRDPETYQLTFTDTAHQEFTQRPPDPPPHPSGYAYYGWRNDGTPIYADASGKPIYYDGTKVKGFSIHRDPVTWEVYILGAV